MAHTRFRLHGGLSRRHFLQAGGLTAAGSLAGCDLLSTDPSGEQEDTGAKGPEAPMLASQVKAGNLPPVDERLPASSMELEPYDLIGRYGGEWRSALLGTANSAYIYCQAAYENLVRWTPDWTGAPGTEEILPNVAETFEVNDESTEFTFRFRDGMRWSDGEPFTADDVVFAINEVLFNEEIAPVPPRLLTTSDQERATVEKVDDYAVRITFNEPRGLFMHRLSSPEGHTLTHFPKHYLEQFLPDHNPELDALVEEEGFSDWVELFAAKAGPGPGANWGENPNLPTLAPWRLVTPFGEGTRVVLERNPYYWKVDPDGSQLPYVDRVIYDVIDDAEVLRLRAANGDINLEVGPDTRFTGPRDKPVLAQDRESGNYDFIDIQDTRINACVLFLNVTHTNQAKREVFANRDFRIGLSYAINRNEVIDTVMQRQGEPYQVAPLETTPFYNEEFAKQYTEFDVDAANEHLDSAGYADTNADGIRLGPTGEPISFTIEFISAFRPEWADMLELIRGYWRDVGVDVTLQPVDRSLGSEHVEANEHDATVWEAAGDLLSAGYFFPQLVNCRYAPPWGQWYASRGAEGEEPPDTELGNATKRQMELYDQIDVTAEPDEQLALMREIHTIAMEQFHSIGVARETAAYFLASNQFRNVPNPIIRGWIYPTPGPTQPSQYFLTRR